MIISKQETKSQPIFISFLADGIKDGLYPILLIFLWLLLNLKIVIKTVFLNTQFLVRGVANTVNLVGLYKRAKVYTPWEKDSGESCKIYPGRALERRSIVKRQLSHLYRSVLLGLCLPSGQLSDFFFHTWPTLDPSPGVHMYPSAKMDLKVKASWRNKTHYGQAF